MIVDYIIGLRHALIIDNADIQTLNLVGVSDDYYCIQYIATFTRQLLVEIIDVSKYSELKYRIKSIYKDIKTYNELSEEQQTAIMLLL